MDRLLQDFYTRGTLEVARDLLGRVLCRRVGPRRVLRGRIVEVEAYDGPRDRASHAYRGLTCRNAPMFDRGGAVYVYRIYGMHHCLNVVTGDRGYPAAVLIRSTEAPQDGVSATGPGRLCRAFRIDRSLDRGSFLGRELWLEVGDSTPRSRVKRTPRIGIAYAGAWAARSYRLVIAGHPDVSGPRSMR